jgi:hypothetical protein
LSDPARKALAHPPDRNQRELAVGVGEDGAFAGDDDIPGQGQFEPAGVAAALDRDDHRLLQFGQPGDDARLVVAGRGLDAALLEVIARAEHRALRSQHDHRDVLTRRLDRGQVRVELAPQREVEGIALVGAVEAQRGDRIAKFVLD